MDQYNGFVMDRMPYPFIEMNLDDMKELGVAAGDLVEVCNDAGSTQAMVQPTPSAKRKQTFMPFGFPHWRAGQRHQCRCQRTHHPEL